MPGNESTRFRSKHERIVYLGNLLNSGREFSVEKLAKLLETNKRSVLRYLKNEVHTILKIENLSSRRDGVKFYYKVPEASRFINITFSLTDALAVKMALEAMQPFEGTQLHGYVRNALKQIHGTLKKANAENFENISSKLVGHSSFRKLYSRKNSVLDDIITGLIYNNMLNLTYQKLDGEPKTFKVAPYSLVAYKNSFYLIAKNENAPDDKGPATYLVERIKNSKRLLNEKFEYPADYDPSDVLPKTGGIIDWDEEEVEIEFTPKMEPILKNIAWPRGTKITKTPGGKVLFKSKLNISPETIQWITGFGPEAKVLKPESLREEIRTLLKNTLAGYETDNHQINRDACKTVLSTR